MRDTITICQLEDDAQLVRYDACSKQLGFYSLQDFTFIGRGVIHSVSGKPWNNEKYYFYQRKADTP